MLPQHARQAGNRQRECYFSCSGSSSSSSSSSPSSSSSSVFIVVIVAVEGCGVVGFNPFGNSIRCVVRLIGDALIPVGRTPHLVTVAEVALRVVCRGVAVRTWSVLVHASGYSKAGPSVVLSPSNLMSMVNDI